MDVNIQSNDSSFIKFPKDDGIELVRKLWERFSDRSSFRFPMNSGIFPSNLLLEISKDANSSRIFG
ncbi:receptor-like protein 12 [Pyrus ussuriensis x Pyrus communis]|uniref:Receptor-like protein 12 n=1 Tax=Pyrus ussuriensis x Pyrus communis TaxID=2448454 RepID=A0A5N5EWW4_9ROSA|nr:receptor-like protein 12 [Pyrus ussuriensis x Pyrus communis]